MTMGGAREPGANRCHALQRLADPHHTRRKPGPQSESTNLIPGAIDNMTKRLEHPGVVAVRTQPAVDAVGDRSRVFASGDCGFAVFIGNAMMTEDICLAKFRALRAGADFASSRLRGERTPAPSPRAADDGERLKLRMASGFR